MSTNYQKNKASILKYMRTSEKYKAYKRKYDEDYRLKNSCYAVFRSLKSTYFKKYGLDLGFDKLLNWAYKKDKKNELCDKTKKMFEEFL